MASGKNTTYANDLLALIFNATSFAGFAINHTTTPLTNLYVSLHTATLSAGSTQSTSEATYTSYARVAVARTNVGWTVTSNTVTPAANIQFPAATGSPNETETYFGIGTTSAGTGLLLYWGTISPTIPVTGAGVTPILSTISTVIEI